MYASTDSQQYAVYNAERSIGLFRAPPLGSIGEAKNILSQLNIRGLDIVFGEHDRYDGCYHSPTLGQWRKGWRGHIDLTPTGRTVCILLHELAHYVTTEGYFGNTDIEAHGPQFTWNYVRLVGWLFGKNNAITLAEAFVKHGVKGYR